MRGDLRTPVEVATGHARLAQLEPGRHPGAGFYADPVAWLVVDAITDALSTVDINLAAVGRTVGVVTISERATSYTMARLGPAAARGRVSPIRFAAANPGLVSGVACIVLGLRGPSLVLTMPLTAGRVMGEVLAHAWLASGACRYVIVNEHEALDPAATDAAGESGPTESSPTESSPTESIPGGHVVRCRIVRSPRDV